MGCNCGGAKRVAGAPRTVGAASPGVVGGATRGTKAPDYYWTGPKKRAAQDAKK